MIYTIKRGSEEIASVRAEGKISTKIMGEELVTMSFSLTKKVTFQINDTVVVYGNTYYLIADPSINKINSREFKYELQFAGVKYRLSEINFFSYDSNNELTLPEFNPIIDAETLVDLVIANANRVQSGWVKGIVDSTGHKQVDFNNHNCLSALNTIAEAFELEFWVDGNKSIHFTERKNASGYSFEYGKGKGLKGISRTQLSESNLVTRLFATGSDKNLPKDYRNGQKKLRMAVPYLEKNTDIYNVIEHTEPFEEIYPKYEGTVTAVDATNPLLFTDANLPFNLNETDVNGNTKILIKGTSAKVIFQSGNLAGYTFEIHEYGFNTATKTFTLLINKDEKTVEIPSTVLRPAIGDKYIIVDIMMPTVYVNDAEALLQTKAQEYLDKNCRIRNLYSVISDPIYFEANNIDIALGFTNHFIDTDFGLDDDIRVTGVVKDLQNKYDVQFDMAEVTSLPGIIRTYIQNSNTLGGIIKNVKFNTELARQSYYFAREMFNKTFDGEGYFDPQNYKPLTIETKNISLGSPMQAFAMPNVKFYVENTLTSVSHTSGELVHFGIINNATRSWFLTENIIYGLSEKFNYIYIKAQKQGTVAEVFISEAQILVDSDPNYYFFEAGVLSSVNDGYRQIKMTHGFGMINPAEISIGRISSPFGGSYIDILQDRIKIHADVEITDDSILFEQINNQIFLGAENLLIGTSAIKEFYDMIEDKDRYLNQELPFTFSVDCISTVQTDAVLVVLGKNKTSNIYEVIATKEFTTKGILERVWVSFKTFLNKYKNIVCQAVRVDNSAQFQTQKPKLEIGNRPTDYNQSQYDANLKISEVEKKTNFLKTSIYGNIVATGTVLLGNYETGTNAGITGEGGKDDVFLWAGADFANKDAAPIRFYRNGTGYLKGVTVEGEIRATTGYIGGNNGWKIEDGLIKTTQSKILFGSEKYGFISGVMLGNDAANSYGFSCNFIINNDKTNSVGTNVGASLNAINGGVNIALMLSAGEDNNPGNTALQIGNGNIVIESKRGFTGTKSFLGQTLNFVKGILVE